MEGIEVSKLKKLVGTDLQKDLLMIVDISDTSDSESGTSKNATVKDAIGLDVNAGLVANSDNKVPSQKAVKSYVDTKVEAVKSYVDTTANTSGKWGSLIGAINGTNKLFSVSQGSYRAGTLEVILNGQDLIVGASNDYVETSPSAGTFTMVLTPVAGDVIKVKYLK